jgi:hypothetical protein
MRNTRDEKKVKKKKKKLNARNHQSYEIIQNVLKSIMKTLVRNAAIYLTKTVSNSCNPALGISA